MWFSITADERIWVCSTAAADADNVTAYGGTSFCGLRRYRRRLRRFRRLNGGRHCVGRRTIRPSGNHHVAGLDRNPFVARRIEPRQTQIVTPIQIGVLTMREPPTAFVIAGTMRVRDVAVDVDGRELHVILIVQRIRGVTGVSGDVQSEARRTGGNIEFAVHGLPDIVVNVLHDDLQGGAVRRRQMGEDFIADPVLAGW